MKTLIIVDFQKDFANKSGSLYVPGSEQAEHAIINYINEHAQELQEVIFTIDWHPSDHCSFNVNGGPWPVHCLQYSEGAGISDTIMHACIDNNIKMKIFQKGDCSDSEEYGAFQYMWKFDENNKIKACNEANQFIYINSNNLVVCGIAGDFCVKHTLTNLIVHNLRENLNLNIEVLRDGIASIDGGTVIDNFIKDENLKTI